MPAIVKDIRTNWKSGLTVALVSVPLSLSLSIASGATPIMGIITAIWAGFVAALFGGSKFNVIGPAGALSGILMSFSITQGAAFLPLLAACSGVLIFVFYLLRWDRYLVFIPSSVMHGFTLGVGLTIALGQMNAALGLKGLTVHESFVMNLYESLVHAGASQPQTLALFAVMLCLLFLLARFAPRVPAVVVAAIIGISIGYLSDAQLAPITVQTLFSKYGTFKAAVFQVPTLALPTLNLAFLKAVFTVTIVAVLETLLSAKIVDAMTKTRFDQKREMLGLSLANIASGLAGGLPATGVLARTALNAKSGATSRASSAINAVFILLIALVLFPVFQYLPLAVVAAILVFAAIRMVEAEHFRKLFQFDKNSFWLAMLVAVLTVAVDPMIAILVGATIALLAFAQHLSRGQSELTLHRNGKVVARIPHHRLGEVDHAPDDVVVYRFAGELTYFNAKSHEDAIRTIAAPTLIFSLRNLFYLDLDGLGILEEIVHHCEQAGKTVIVTGASEFIKPLLEKATWFKRKERNGTVFDSTSTALKTIGATR